MSPEQTGQEPPHEETLEIVVLHPAHPEALERIAALPGRPHVTGVRFIDSSAVRGLKGQGLPPGEGEEWALDADQLAALAKADVVLGLDIPWGFRELAPNVRWVQAYGAGIAQLSVPLQGSDVILTTGAGVGAPAIAEFVMARLLEVWKRLREVESAQRGHEWTPIFGSLVAGRTLGLVGFGAIGREVAKRAQAFGMRILVVRRDPTAATGSEVDAVFGTSRLPEMLSQADAVVVAVPETSETQRLIGATELAAMRPGSIFCNVGRGSLLDEDALLDALARDQLAAAVLDVTNDEPLPADSPLWETPNVYLSAHCAISRESYDDRVLALFAENLARFRTGEPLINTFDYGRGY